jgi:hypothetical protein
VDAQASGIAAQLDFTTGRRMLLMMLRILFIALAFFATMPASLCGALCFELSRVEWASSAMDRGDPSAMVSSHCSGTATTEAATVNFNPESDHLLSLEDDRSCARCDVGGNAILVAALEPPTRPDLMASTAELFRAEGWADAPPRIQSRAPPDRDRSPYVATRRPLLI